MPDSLNDVISYIGAGSFRVVADDKPHFEFCLVFSNLGNCIFDDLVVVKG